MEKINDIHQLDEVVILLKKVFISEVSKLQEIAQDNATPFVVRKIIGMLTSDDEKLSLQAMQWVHQLLLNDFSSIELEETINVAKVKNLGTYVLTIPQNEIFKTLVKQYKPKEQAQTDLLCLYAQNIDAININTAIVAKIGYKMTYKTGAEQIRPEVTVIDKAVANIEKIINMLGYKKQPEVKPKNIPSIMNIVTRKATI